MKMPVKWATSEIMVLIIILLLGCFENGFQWWFVFLLLSNIINNDLIVTPSLKSYKADVRKL